MKFITTTIATLLVIASSASAVPSNGRLVSRDALPEPAPYFTQLNITSYAPIFSLYSKSSDIHVVSTRYTRFPNALITSGLFVSLV
ncbi:hypothetical protein IQ07DRAFT_590541 [Pyrenochaeta sp. DS3sAY3a]|nr:hypothetical protein IQ07DRAFT_590541 [Pyrenochaeta sp. DS3sAY3a]